jgi:hypothetical protein
MNIFGKRQKKKINKYIFRKNGIGTDFNGQTPTIRGV